MSCEQNSHALSLVWLSVATRTKSGLEECYYSCDWTKVKALHMHMMVGKMAQEQKVVPVQYKT